ncbi:MAG: hypothetical protein PUH82_04570 [Bacteroidales bacterium]|nr:hypothetical protein [Bacteroidales bacterium]
MSSSPRQDASGVLVGWVPVPKSCRKPPLPRGDGSEVLVGKIPVTKTGQKPPLPREDGSEVPVGRGAVPKRSVGSGAGGASYLFSIGMYSLSSVTQR